MKILCVEDDLQFQRLLKEGIEQDRFTDYQVDIAGTLREAFERLAERDYGCIVIDIKLPNGKGTVIIDAMQNKTPGTPMVAMTGDDSVAGGDVILRGAQDFLLKPFAIKRLLESISLAIARHKVRGMFAPLDKKLNEAATDSPISRMRPAMSGQ